MNRLDNKSLSSENCPKETGGQTLAESRVKLNSFNLTVHRSHLQALWLKVSTSASKYH